jgi:hypothetical protein
MGSVWRYVLIGAGTLFLALGVVGAFLPLLPTTPFLLLSAACYARGSRRFYGWLMGHRVLGEYIRNYREGKGLPLRTKVVALTLLWLTITSSALFVVESLPVRIVLFLVAVGVTAHLLYLPTLRR